MMRYQTTPCLSIQSNNPPGQEKSTLAPDHSCPGLFLYLYMQEKKQQDHWKWRYEMADAMAANMDMDRFGVKALYLIGSVKTGNAGPCSDIDFLAHCEEHSDRHELLRTWCDGWGLCLAEINKKRTCYKTSGSLVDLHIITDKDIKNKTSFAHMLESVSNTAKLLRKAARDE